MGLFCLDLFLVLGALDMTAAPSLTTFLAQPEVIRVSASMAGLAFSGALLVVPAFSALQTWAKAERRARTVAGANALSAGFMTIGGLVLAGSLAAGFPQSRSWPGWLHSMLQQPC